MIYQPTRIIFLLKDNQPLIQNIFGDIIPIRLFDITELIQRFKFEYEEIAREYQDDDEKLFAEQIYAQMTEAEKPLFRLFYIECYTKLFADKVYQELKDPTKYPQIEIVEYDNEVELYYNPNDPYYADTWGLTKIEANKAWDVSLGDDIVIAVIDTGIDYTHPDIINSMWKDSSNNYGIDIADNDNDPLDTNGHGTHVAGIIAATIDNNIGICGVAPKAKLMAVKIFPNGAGRVYTSDMFTYKGIKYAVDNGAKILSNSWGPTERRPSHRVLELMIDYAHSNGCIVTFGAGNADDDVIYYSPANYTNVISVAATDFADQRCSFSNYGNRISLAAPGDEILSLENNTGGYVKKRGTSMACPHVSGVIALMLIQKPKLTLERAKYYLKKGIDLIPSDKPIGWGRLNANKAVLESIKPIEIIGIVIIFNLTSDDKDREEEIQITVEKAGKRVGYRGFGRGTKWSDPGRYPCKLILTETFNESELDYVTVRMFKTPFGSATGNGMQGSIEIHVVYEGDFEERNLYIPERRYGDNNPYDVVFNLVKY